MIALVLAALSTFKVFQYCLSPVFWAGHRVEKEGVHPHVDANTNNVLPSAQNEIGRAWQRTDDKSLDVEIYNHKSKSSNPYPAFDYHLHERHASVDVRHLKFLCWEVALPQTRSMWKWSTSDEVKEWNDAWSKDDGTGTKQIEHVNKLQSIRAFQRCIRERQQRRRAIRAVCTYIYQFHGLHSIYFDPITMTINYILWMCRLNFPVGCMIWRANVLLWPLSIIRSF